MPTYNECKLMLVELRQQMRVLARPYFGSLAKDLFTKVPTLESFSWTQYTAYEDGCEFTVYADELCVYANDARGDEIDIETPWQEREAYKAEYAEKLKIHMAVAELLTLIEEEDMLQMFGDHKQITINRDGTVETDSYDHD